MKNLVVITFMMTPLLIAGCASARRHSESQPAASVRDASAFAGEWRGTEQMFPSSLYPESAKLTFTIQDDGTWTAVRNNKQRVSGVARVKGDEVILDVPWTRLQTTRYIFKRAGNRLGGMTVEYYETGNQQGPQASVVDLTKVK